MGKRVGLAFVVLLLGGAAQADHAFVPEIEPQPELLPVAAREVCTVSEWAFDEVRTDCRMEVLAPQGGNPALRGLCTTRYGQRTCY